MVNVATFSCGNFSKIALDTFNFAIPNTDFKLYINIS